MVCVSLIRRLLAIVIVTLCLSPLGPVAAEEESQPPRYKLQVGQELRYSGSDLFKYERGQFETDSTWTVWVVRQNADGNWRLLVQNSTKVKQNGSNANESSNLAWCDFHSNGELIDNDSLGFQMSPGKLLPQLPENIAQAHTGWSRKDERMDEVVRYKVLADRLTDEKLVLQSSRQSPMNDIYGWELDDIITFDVARGLPEKIESRTRQTYGFNGSGEGMLKLDAIEMRGEAWCNEFAADAERYFAAKEAYFKAVNAELSAESMDATIAALKSLGEEVKSPLVRDQIENLLDQHRSLAGHYAERAKKRAALLNKPAADWKAEDFDGKAHALTDYRGKVVVLDFWYRGCGWCVRAMPQMKEIATHFAGEPVAVLGMNTDRVEDDARFVIDKMGLNYPNLKAADIPAKYHISGFPTLLIIDQKGTLHEIHSGYSPTLKDEVVQSIGKLLAGSPQE